MSPNPILRLAFALPLFADSGVAQARPEFEIVEIPVNKIFVPARGFDDNDSVEAVLDGQLPSPCYTLEKQKVEYNPALHQFTIRQFAVRQRMGVCAGPDDKGGSVTETRIPFTEPVTLGRLDTGNYSVVYNRGEEPGTSQFQVHHAAVPTADDRPYAVIRSVEVPDRVRTGARTFATINGILINSCYELDNRVDVELVDDVAVVLPTVRVQTGRACLEYIRPFSIEVDLGGFRQAGRYLVHVRSMHGKSVNAAFSAVPTNRR